MPTVDDYHLRAMDLAEDAFLAKKQGHIDRAKQLFSEAYRLERSAAELLPPEIESEPTRSVLFRSAATMAYHAAEYGIADKLISFGQIGFPPPEIQTELRELRQDVMFMLGLQSHGREISDSQWTMILDGNAVKHGGTDVDSFMMRVDKVTKLVYRTVERLLDKEYRISGGVSKDIKENFGVYLNVAPGSFRVLFQLGTPSSQMLLFPDLQEPQKLRVATVVDEVITCFDLMQRQNLEALRNKIQDKDYFDNFMGLAKQIAPDGEKIKYVGFKARLNDKEEVVVLRKKQKEITQEIQEINRQESKENEGDVEEFKQQGILTYASSPKNRKMGLVKLILRDGHTQPIKVPISLMKDVVQPHYEEEVEIIGVKKGKTYYLEQITPLA